ncbi:MAG: flagellar basal body P-ring formation chaperone FlgA [Gemmatimonadaceae bacterium]
MNASWIRRVVRWLVVGSLPMGLLAGTRAQAQQDTLPVLVATRPLPRGTVLTESDMTLSTHPLGERRGSGRANELRPEPGWITRRVIRAGEVLASPAVTPAPTIASGAAVHYVVRRGDLELAVPAVAVTSASDGQPITVRFTTPPQRRATGIVAGPARVVAPSDF